MKIFDDKFFTAKTDPLNLAVLRIVFFSFIPWQIAWERILFLSELPANLRIPPFGLSWLVPHLPITPLLVRGAGTLLIVCCITAAAGLFARLSAFIVALLAFYVFGVDCFFGDVSHNHHHIVPFALILALSPCGDALSMDSWRKKYHFAPSTSYTLPIRFVWLLMGAFYFFPGFWKLYHSGWAWAFSDNMKYQLWGKWFWQSWTPFFRIDQYPVLYKGAGLFTLIFETGFLFALFFPPLRTALALIAIGFHTMTAFFLHVAFWSLVSCYVSFIDWAKLLKKIPGTMQKTTNKIPLTVVSLGMLAISTTLGFAHIRFSWPFACYPDFRAIRGEICNVKEYVLLSDNDTALKPAKLEFHGKRFRSLLKVIDGIQDPEEKKRKTEALVHIWEERDPKLRDATILRVYKTTYTTDPAKKNLNPLKKEIAWEISLIGS